MAALFYAALFLVAWSYVPCECCQDVDGASCATLLAQNPDLCLEEIFSFSACPKTCGKCSVTCYHCDDPLTDFTQCTNTKTCQPGEKCMLTELVSAGDGHSEYKMLCASIEMCDGIGIFIGRRDISTHCCTDDLCNTPDHFRPRTTLPVTSSTPTTMPTTTTSTSTTMATTATTTSMQKDCPRDILVFVEDSDDRTMDTHVKQFLTDLATDLRIGANDTLIALTLFHTQIHTKWILDKSETSTSLISKINALSFSHAAGAISYINLKHAIGEYVNSYQHGDRRNFADIVIILTDHQSSPHFFNHHGQIHDVDITSHSRGVIVVNVGSEAQRQNAFVQFANNASYVLNIGSHLELPTIHQNLLTLICN